jgi:hypothetical protein
MDGFTYHGAVTLAGVGALSIVNMHMWSNRKHGQFNGYVITS